MCNFTGGGGGGGCGYFLVELFQVDRVSALDNRHRVMPLFKIAMRFPDQLKQIFVAVHVHYTPAF